MNGFRTGRGTRAVPGWHCPSFGTKIPGVPQASGGPASRRAAEASWSTRVDQDRRDRLDAAQSGKAADAVEIDSTGLGLDEVVGIIAGLVPQALRKSR